MRNGMSLRAVLVFSVAVAMFAGPAGAETYVWDNSNVAGSPASPLDWFTGGTALGLWTGPVVPVSDNTATIQFFANTSTALTNTANPSLQTSNINNGGAAFQLGTLTLSGKASATANANLTMTISGDPLNFSGAAGTINLDGVNNTRILTYNLNSAIQLGTAGSANALTITGNGSGTFNIGGIISELQLGGGSLIKSGSSTLTIPTKPTYTGATIINGGTLSVDGQGASPLSNSSGITFTGNSTLLYNGGTSATLPSTTINSGVTANFKNTSSGSGSGIFTIPSISGSGTFSADNPGGTGQGKTVAFSDLSAFTGVLQMSLSGASLNFNVSNLNDTVPNNIRFAGGGGILNSPNRFRYVGSAGLTLTNRAIEFANGANAFLSIENNGTSNSNLIINSDLAVTATGAKTLLLSGTNTGGTSTFAGTITDGSGTISLTKINGTTWNLTNAANTFSGAITLGINTGNYGTTNTVANGTLNYASAGGANPINFNLSTGSGTLNYTGSTDKTMSGAITASALTSGTITLGSTGDGAVNYSNTGSLGSATSNTVRKLILSGTNTGNNILAGKWVNNTGTSNAATLTKNGTCTWVLTGSNTHTGATTVNAGKLLLGQGGSMDATAVSVTGTGTTYGMARTSSGASVQGGSTLSLATGTILNLQDTNTNTMSFTSTGTLSGADLYFDLGATATDADKVVLTGATTVTGINTFYFNALGGLAIGTPYTLIDAVGGLAGDGTFAIGSAMPTGYTLALASDATGVYLNVTLDIVPGDTNDDNVVDAADFITMKKNFGTDTGAGVAQGNFNGGDPGTVDWDDLSILMSNVTPSAGGIGGAPIPEPATLGLLALGAIAVIRRNRRS